ncbi:MAG: hypothetical protein QF787_15915, partial [Nitrospinota bacterium]|nr:hypothetical protein [Nitrospinota bacterium]
MKYRFPAHQFHFGTLCETWPYEPDGEESERFERESRLMASLRHPNIVFVLDRGETDGQHWIAMEHIDGQSLA